MDNYKQIDDLFLDFAKAFDTVLHQQLLKKLQYYGIDDKIYYWISEWLLYIQLIDLCYYNFHVQ